MAKFNNLSRLEPRADAVVELELDILGSPAPTLLLRPADETNKPFLNASLKGAAVRAKTARRAGVTAETLVANRNRDRLLFSKHVVTGWRHVVDDKGKEVPFSEEDCFDFLTALPDWMFDEVREFAATPSNFVDQPEVEDLGNS